MAATPKRQANRVPSIMPVRWTLDWATGKTAKGIAQFHVGQEPFRQPSAAETLNS
jgi:hypothetical protein